MAEARTIWEKDGIGVSYIGRGGLMGKGGMWSLWYGLNDLIAVAHVTAKGRILVEFVDAVAPQQPDGAARAFIKPEWVEGFGQLLEYSKRGVTYSEEPAPEEAFNEEALKACETCGLQAVPVSGDRCPRCRRRHVTERSESEAS